MLIRLLALQFSATLLLTGCPGAVIQPLPPGTGPGNYAGQFTSDEDDTLIGTFTLTISSVGQVSGTGVIDGRAVSISGTFSGTQLDGLLTETLTQLSGRFDGLLVGAQLAGDFRLPRDAGSDLTGLWDAAPQS